MTADEARPRCADLTRRLAEAEQNLKREEEHTNF